MTDKNETKEDLNLIDHSKTRIEMRGMFKDMLALTKLQIKQATVTGEISAALLNSLLQASRYLKDTWDSFQQDDFKEDSKEGGLSEWQKEMMKDYEGQSEAFKSLLAEEEAGRGGRGEGGGGGVGSREDFHQELVTDDPGLTP